MILFQTGGLFRELQSVIVTWSPLWGEQPGSCKQQDQHIDFPVDQIALGFQVFAEFQLDTNAIKTA